MSVFKLSSRDFPQVKKLGLGQKVIFKLSGKVSGIEEDGKDLIVSVISQNAEFEESKERRNPGELMKEMVKLQGMVNTPRP